MSSVLLSVKSHRRAAQLDENRASGASLPGSMRPGFSSLQAVIRPAINRPTASQRFVLIVRLGGGWSASCCGSAADYRPIPPERVSGGSHPLCRFSWFLVWSLGSLHPPEVAL